VLNKLDTSANDQRMKMHGSLDLILRRADGSVETRHKDNLIVDSGFDFIANAIGNAASRPNAISHIAVGTGTTVAAGSQTTLVTELVRSAGTFAHVSGTKVFTFTVALGAGVATGALTEAGVLNASSLGSLLDRVVFNVVNKGPDDTLTIVFTFTMS
jgi:hypothetical protein